MPKTLWRPAGDSGGVANPELYDDRLALVILMRLACQEELVARIATGLWHAESIRGRFWN